MEPIDIGEVIRKKSPSLARRLPGFVIRLIGKIVHIGEINDVLRLCEGKRGVEFAEGTLEYLNVKSNIRYEDRNAFRRGDKYIFVSNHPLGGLDGLILTAEINRRFGPAKFLVNNILMNVEPLQDVFVPVNNLGRAANKELAGVRDIYRSDFHVLNFPAGACSRLIKGKIQDLPWKKSFVRESLKCGRSIVPVYFGGKNSKRFYWTSKIRMALGIKAFIEMILLPDEMFRQRNKTFDVVIGTPVSPEEIKNSGKSPQEWCDAIRQRVYEYASSNTTDR